VNSGTATGGIKTLYLWFVCDQYYGDGLTAAEFNISGPPGSIFAFTPMNGFLNAGGAINLLLATACNHGPVVAGNWLVLDVPGEFCIVPSTNLMNIGVDCNPNPSLWGNNTIGFNNSGAYPSCAPLYPLCAVVNLEPQSWGKVKAMYR
jgi:hypothetical protein